MKLYDPERDEFVHGLRTRITKLIADCDETIAVAESWEENRDGPTIDVSYFRTMRDGAVKALAAVNAGEPVDLSWMPEDAA